MNASIGLRGWFHAIRTVTVVVGHPKTRPFTDQVLVLLGAPLCGLAAEISDAISL
jgi:hypothetical protein